MLESVWWGGMMCWTGRLEYLKRGNKGMTMRDNFRNPHIGTVLAVIFGGWLLITLLVIAQKHILAAVCPPPIIVSQLPLLMH
jgi:hypothetical protein